MNTLDAESYFSEKLSNLKEIENPSFMLRRKIELLQRGLDRGSVLHSLRYSRDVSGDEAADQLLNSFTHDTHKELGKDA
jgi:hypothetical protein